MMKWWWLPGYLWALPHTLIGFLLMPFYGVKKIRWVDGALEVVTKRDMLGKPMGQTHGWLIYYRTDFRGSVERVDLFRRTARAISVHERTHVIQGLIGGPLFTISYVLMFFGIWAWKRDGWFNAYEMIPYEVQARRRAVEFVAGAQYWGG